YPYAFLLASIAGPIASAVDPMVVRQNGGVVAGERNAWMATHMVGTGPYILNGGVLDIESAPSYTLNPDPKYWGVNASNDEPFNNWSVRQAVVHAINYGRIIQLAFGGYAEPWVGPVPPGYPYYNPDNLQPYAYNLTLAKQYMSQSPWPNGYPNTINYEYVNLGDWADVARLLQDDLAQIGITLNTVSIPNIDKLYELQRLDGNGDCIAQTTANGGPFPIGQEFYTSDYISPDDWTQNNAISYGSANSC